MKITLAWYGPYSFEDILVADSLRERFASPGVYLWYETLPTGVRQLCYVGKATRSTTLWGRHLQHYASLVGGLYRIPKEFGGWESDWSPDWRRKDVVTVMLDQTRFMSIVEAGFRRAKTVEIYLCPLADDFDPGKIERQLLYELKPTGTRQGTVSMPVNILDITHLNRPW